MKVSISSTVWYDEREMIEKYPWLHEFDFSIKKVTRKYYNGQEYECDQAFIVINDMKDILHIFDGVVLSDKYGIILQPSLDEEFDFHIEIYDGYRE